MQALVTGGAGFIGSNLALELLAAGHRVRVVDNMSTGRADNLSESDASADFEMVEGDVNDAALMSKLTSGADVVFHQAALGSVPRSVGDPLTTDTANTHGTLTVLRAAQESGARFVFASSSSVYGGDAEIPTPESAPMAPKSPYAVTKVAGEHYCQVFARVYGTETLVLRYFNVFGPRQRADSPYAAVIPLFIDALAGGHPVTIHGDGKQSRDFTFVSDVVAANLAAATAPSGICTGRAYNVAAGRNTSVLDLLTTLEAIMGVRAERVHREPRAGDVRRSGADVGAAARDLRFRASVEIHDALSLTVASFAASAAT